MWSRISLSRCGRVEFHNANPAIDLQINLALAVTAWPFSALQQLTTTRGLPKYLQVVQDIVLCRLELWVGNLHIAWVIAPQKVQISADPDSYVSSYYCDGSGMAGIMRDHYVKPNPEDRDIKNRYSGHHCEGVMTGQPQAGR